MMKNRSSTTEEISGHLDNLSPERRALLASKLKRREFPGAGARISTTALGDEWLLSSAAGMLEGPPIRPAPRDHHQPLSFAQQRLWFIDQLEPGSAAYNLPGAFKVTGPLSATALEACLNEIAKRHEILRTWFADVDGRPVQVVAPPSRLTLPVMDLAALPEGARNAEVVRLADEDANRPFDLSQGPLFRISLVRSGDEEHVMLLNMHHIVSDAWSTRVLISEASALYEAFLAGLPSPLNELELQYVDFAYWQRERLQGEVLEKHLSYWRQHLGDLSVLELPTDRQRTPAENYRGARESRAFGKETSEAFKSLCRAEGVTLFMGTLAAFKALLCRYTGGYDIVIGTPIANRNRREVEGLIGFFVNTLVLRTNLGGDPTFRQLLGRVREVALGAYAHQDLPFETLVEDLQPERHLSVQPLFQVMFAFQNAAMPSLNSGNLIWSPLGGENTTSKFDLTLTVAEESDGLIASFEYSTDLFDGCRIRRMLDHLGRLIECTAANPEQRVSELSMLTEAETNQVLFEWNDTRLDYGEQPLVTKKFEEQVGRTPDRTAVVFEEERLTYRELNARANRLAHHLQSLGVGPDVMVGICVERSLDMVVATLGVLKAGGAYVPLDPAYPSDRLAFMLEDAQICVLITQSHLISSLPRIDARLLCLDSDWAEIQNNIDASPVTRVDGDNLAYAIYTSGSTGRPKGIGLPHRALANLIEWHEATMLTGARTLQFASLSFDASFHEMFSAWQSGGTIFVAGEAMRRDVESLAAYLLDAGIEKMTLPVVVLQQLAEHYISSNKIPAGIREITTTGEQMQITGPIKQLFRQLTGCPLNNHYGPSESHVVTSHTLLSDPENWPMHPPIGRPIYNTQIYLLDVNLKPVPVGVAAELYIGGVSLARGYLNRPELTAEKFVPDPLGSEPGGRLYRTGDQARYRADGQIEYLGRIDHQVKVRGYRIELGEIESVLGEHPAVVEVAVEAREDEPGHKRLVAYLVFNNKSEPTVTELFEFSRGKLPDYMLPSAFVVLDHMPLTPNGKVDRRALPAPERGRPDLKGDFVSPRTVTEQLLAEIWAEVLGVERMGIHDSFFALGGHSLLATQVVSRTRTVFGIDLTVRNVFETPTIAGLARSLDSSRDNNLGHKSPPIKPVSRDVPLPLSYAQQRLWFIDRLNPGTPHYNIPIAVRLSGVLDQAAFERSLNEIVRRHEPLRTCFPEISGQPLQVICLASPMTVQIVDLSDLPEGVRQAEAQFLARSEAMQPFNLARVPLLRAKLLRLAEQDHVALLTMHHIVTDGWSMGVLVREIAALYEAFSSGKPSPLAALPIQYADYAWFQREWLQGETLATQLSYWREKLGGELSTIKLPFDKPRPPTKGYRGAGHTLIITGELVDSLKELDQREQVTLYMTLLAAFKILLHCYSGMEEIIVGSPIAGRRRAEIEGLVGFFVNTLVMRTDLGGDPSFREMLRRIREETLEAYAHQDVPFERIVEELQPERSLNSTPLFQVEFTLQNAPIEPLQLPGLTLSPLEISGAGDDFVTAQYDLMFDVSETPDGLVGALRYDTDLFNHQTILQMAWQFESILRAAVADPDARLSSLRETFIQTDKQYRAAAGTSFKNALSEKLKLAKRKR